MKRRSAKPKRWPAGTTEALIKSGFEGDGLQAVRKYRKITAALAAEGLRRHLIRISLRRDRKPSSEPLDDFYPAVVWAVDAVLSAESFHAVSEAGGMKLMARSLNAVMVRLGLTPRLPAITEPSHTYMFL